MAFMVCTVTYGLESSWKGTICDEVDEGNSYFLVFQHGRVTVALLGKHFRWTMPFSSQRTEVMIFPADGNIKNLCFPGNVVWHLSVDCYLQRSTNVPTNSIYHKGDLKQDPYWWPTNVSTTINLITWATWCLGFEHPWPLGFWFKMVDTFHPHYNLWQEALTLCFVSVQEINDCYFPCLFVCIC
jgi:hypothetical protein